MDKYLLNLQATEGGFGTQIKSVESADKKFAVVSKFEKLKSCQIYLVKRTFFSELQLCRLVSFQSLGLGKGYIPLLKALKPTN